MPKIFKLIKTDRKGCYSGQDMYFITYNGVAFAWRCGETEAKQLFVDRVTRYNTLSPVLKEPLDLKLLGYTQKDVDNFQVIETRSV